MTANNLPVVTHEPERDRPAVPGAPATQSLESPR